MIHLLIFIHILSLEKTGIQCSQVMIQMGGHFASRRQEQQRLGRLLRWGPVKRRRFEETGVAWATKHSGCPWGSTGWLVPPFFSKITRAHTHIYIYTCIYLCLCFIIYIYNLVFYYIYIYIHDTCVEGGEL